MITTPNSAIKKLQERIELDEQKKFSRDLVSAIKAILHEGKIDHEELLGNEKDVHPQYLDKGRLQPIVDKILNGFVKVKDRITELSETQEKIEKNNEKKRVELNEKIDLVRTKLGDKSKEIEQELKELEKTIKLTETLARNNATISLSEKKQLELAEDRIDMVLNLLNKYIEKKDFANYIDLKGDGVEIKRKKDGNKVIFEIKSRGQIGRPIFTFNGAGGGSNVGKFTDLTDVPSTYTGSAGKIVAVNATATALEFTTAGAGTGDMVGATYDPTGVGKDAFASNNIVEGTSNFFFRGDRFRGAGGASVSVNGKSVTIYSQKTNLLVNGLSVGNRTNLEIGSTIGGIILQAVDDPTTDTMTLLLEQDKLIVNGFSNGEIPFTLHDPVSGLDYLYYDTNLRWGATEQQLILGGTYLHTDEINEGISNFYYKTTRYVGTGGASVSVNGITLTIYSSVSGGGASLSDNLGEGVSNFFWRADRLTATQGASISINGVTATIIGASMPLNTDYLPEGASNFYDKPYTYIGTGGVSVSGTGQTITIFGLSMAVNTDQVSEGSSNFYWRVDRVSASGGASIIYNGITLEVYASTSGGGGVSLSDNIGEGVSNFFFRGDRFVGTGGASISVDGVTVTIYSASSSGGMAWSEITGNSWQGAINNGYICNCTGLTVLSIARTANVTAVTLGVAHNLEIGDIVTITGMTGLDYALPAVAVKGISGSTIFTYQNSGATATTLGATADVSGFVYPAVDIYLPATAAIGSEIAVISKGIGGFRFRQAANQYIRMGAQKSTTGTSGSIYSTIIGDGINIINDTADVSYISTRITGNLTLV